MGFALSSGNTKKVFSMYLCVISLSLLILTAIDTALVTAPTYPAMNLSVGVS